MANIYAPRALTQEMEPENDNIYGPQVEMQNIPPVTTSCMASLVTRMVDKMTSLR